MLRKTILIDWFLKRYEIWNLRNVIANLKWIYWIIFWGQNEKIGHDISDLLRPNCPLDRLTNDNNSKIKPDNTNKIFAVRSTIFQDSSFVCQAKIICNLLFEQKIIENLLFRANTEIEIADLFFFFFLLFFLLENIKMTNILVFFWDHAYDWQIPLWQIVGLK